MSSSNPSFLIVGAGIFGVGTAYELIKKYPNASVTIVDRDAFDADDRVAASWDWNKVVRADYDDIDYCRLAIEAQDVFKSEPLWQPYFHEVGVVWMCRGNYAQDVINNYKKLGRKADLSAVSISEARELYNGLYKNADFTNVTEVLVNKTSGWVAAGDVLRAVTREALRLGVKYVVADVNSIQLDSQGNTRGVRTRDGQLLTASHVILCTGAYTSKLLEYSAADSGRPELSDEGRIVAGGIVTGMHTLDQKSFDEKYKDMPVGMQGYPAGVSPFLGALTPTPDERRLKWWGSHIFSNTVEVLPGRCISTPPVARDYAQWKVSKALQKDISYVSQVFFGKEAANWDLDKFRVCWDAFTSTGDFIVSPHSGSKGLYVATCGGFHGFKFFPVIGKYVVQMLEGTLEDGLKQKWAWDRERPDSTLNPEYPRIELNELLDTVPKL